MKIGLIGCGNIGRAIAKAVAEGRIEGAQIVVIGDVVESEALKALAKQQNCAWTTRIESFLDYELDLVVEAASPAAVRQYAPLFLDQGISMMVMSTGAFVDEDLYCQVGRLAAANNCYVYIPSGAIGAVDLFGAHREGGLEEVSITARKPPANLVKYTDEGKITFAHVTEPLIVFEGPAREAVKQFPENINVAATISLAGIGPDKTVVKIIADPGVSRNTFEIEARGKYGLFKLTLENLPSPDNPKTSYAACLSAIALLKKIKSHVKLGA